MRGFAAIGLIQPKDIQNIGGVLRAAQVYRAAMVAIQGDRTPIRQREDTGKAYKHIPVVRGNNIHDLCPLGAKRIAVDLVDYAKPLPTYQHPESAFYIFGPEDGTLDESILSSCDERIMIPTKFCMNLAATVNVILYDRMVKRG